MSYRLINANNIAFNSDGFITTENIEKMPCIYADLPNGMDGEHYVLEQQPKWIPIVTRPLTDEDRKEYGAEIESMYDCLLPKDSQDVLVTTPYGVRQTTFYTDYGCYFENYEDEGDVIAWMPLPQPYAESEG